jgi:mutator protein MutT
MGGIPEDAIRVVAAVIEVDGRLLVSKRPEGTHLGGYWELPGGKVEPGETDEAALARELHEEVGIRARVQEPFDTIVHAYPERKVALVVYRCAIESGEPRAITVDAVAWAPLDRLDEYAFPEADAPLIARLARPRQAG